MTHRYISCGAIIWPSSLIEIADESAALSLCFSLWVGLLIFLLLTVVDWSTQIINKSREPNQLIHTVSEGTMISYEKLATFFCPRRYSQRARSKDSSLIRCKPPLIPVSSENHFSIYLLFGGTNLLQQNAVRTIQMSKSSELLIPSEPFWNSIFSF